MSSWCWSLPWRSLEPRQRPFLSRATEAEGRHWSAVVHPAARRFRRFGCKTSTGRSSNSRDSRWSRRTSDVSGQPVPRRVPHRGAAGQPGVAPSRPGRASSGESRSRSARIRRVTRRRACALSFAGSEPMPSCAICWVLKLSFVPSGARSRSCPRSTLATTSFIRSRCGCLTVRACGARPCTSGPTSRPRVWRTICGRSSNETRARHGLRRDRRLDRRRLWR